MSRTAARLARFIRDTPCKLDALHALLAAADHDDVSAEDYAALATILIEVHP